MHWVYKFLQMMVFSNVCMEAANGTLITWLHCFDIMLHGGFQVRSTCLILKGANKTHVKRMYPLFTMQHYPS